MPPVLVDWQTPPRSPLLAPGIIHIWRVDLDALGYPSWFDELLSPDERSRAGRFYFERDRRRFTVGRALLRIILGNHLDRDPTELGFTYSSRGKPALVADPLTFNLSHSHGLALYAIGCDRPVGIDLEKIRPIQALALAQRFFSLPEASLLDHLPKSEQQWIFFRLWTSKEACLKALGEGIANLRDVEVTLEREGPVNLQRPDPIHWTLQELCPAEGYVAALVTPADPQRLCCWQWPVDDPH